MIEIPSGRAEFDVVVLDDEDHWLRLFNRINERRDGKFRFRTFTSPKEALRIAIETRLDGRLFAAFVDLELGSEKSGIDFIIEARDAGVEVPFIIQTQYEAQQLEGGINSILNGVASYYVNKNDMRFGARTQNVDRIAEAAHARHADNTRRMLREYARQSRLDIAGWRSALASVVETLDRALIVGAGPGISTASPIIGAVRAALTALMSRMQLDHVRTAALVSGGPVPASAVPSPKVSSLDLAAAMPRLAAFSRSLAAALSATSHRNADVDGRGERLALAEAVSRSIGALPTIEQSLTASLAVEELAAGGHAAESRNLALAVADYFSLVREPDQEVAFSVIAARVSERMNDRSGREAAIERAERVARRSGRLSLQMELTGLDG